jgi:glycosyltransferase involved in cell wall biosynthesis
MSAMAFEAPRLSIVVPAYQEGEGIGASLREIRARALQTGLDLQIVVVDDGSTDRTWEELSKAQREMPEVGLIRLSRNFGKEAAISAGLDHVDGDACILIDADLQHPPSLIPEMVKQWRDGKWDVVEAVKRSRGRESLARRVVVRTFYSIVGGLTGQTLQDASDFKLLDRRVLVEWRRLGERATFFRGLVSWMGFRTTRVLFDVPPRQIGQSRWSMIGLASLALRAITAFSALPLQMVTVLGSVMLLLALVFGAQALRLWLRGDAFPGFTTVILLQLIIGGFLMVSLGIIGTYIARIYDEVKARPRYIVQDRAGALASRESAHAVRS